MLDLDDFKKVNDVYGHGIGDHLLHQVADVLRASVRASRRRLPRRRRGVRCDPALRRRPELDRARRAHRRAARQARGGGRRASSPSRRGSPSGLSNAANPRELVACAEAAMMTAKTRGNGLVVPFDESDRERPSEERDSARRRALDRAPEDAAEPLREALSPQRRRADRPDDRGRAPAARRLPQLPRLPPRRGRPRPGRVPRRPHRDAPGDPVDLLPTR